MVLETKMAVTAGRHPLRLEDCKKREKEGKELLGNRYKRKLLGKLFENRLKEKGGF